jgi:hypothetical protein
MVSVLQPSGTAGSFSEKQREWFLRAIVGFQLGKPMEKKPPGQEDTNFGRKPSTLCDFATWR